MGILLLLLLSLFALGQANRTQFEDKQWELFKISHSKEYSSQEEEIKRMEIFLKNLELIREHNTRYDRGEVSYTTSINIYSDWTDEELSSLHGYRPSSKNDDWQPEMFSPAIGTPLPHSVDWRNKGAVTPVKNQKNCGSCWAFSTTGSIEGQHFRKHQKLVSLSEQNLLDCAHNYGCGEKGGGFPKDAFSYVIKNGGIDTEASYPYEDEKLNCRFNPDTIGATVKGIKQISPGNEAALQYAVATIGPISVCIDASGMEHYHGDVFYNPRCSTSRLDHAVLVVGYGTTKDGKDYWIVKNSWSTNWGMEGYIMMARNKNNMCGIASNALFPIV